ncbi:MAG: 4-hydroxy-tetrahydrodipicolinate synthase [Candidatus Heimdallarchaeota archaeon]|nr:4-hydroxy-tetrahydrodipicolinate synthase [Candidatus Heimdallarchaeota archaeon]
MQQFEGCYTAIVSPMDQNHKVDYESLQRLVEFQAENGVSGILAVGTTGESATLTMAEQEKVIEKVNTSFGNNGLTIAGTGSNSTEKAIKATKFAREIDIEAVLLVDPYYNGPSSMEIRREYIMPIAESFPEIQIIPYIIPGRSGTQLLPQDIAILNSQFDNIRAVKEATGNLENMKAIRKHCENDFDILSGDDGKTRAMISSPEIRATGVISVASNIVPKAVQEFVDSLLKGDSTRANKLASELEPLFNIITVKTMEPTNFGSVLCRARNPLPCKTLMNILGMISSPCRRPLGKMTKKGIKIILDVARRVYNTAPEIFEPIEQFFDVNLSRRLFESRFWEDLYYA